MLFWHSLKVQLETLIQCLNSLNTNRKAKWRCCRLCLFGLSPQVIHPKRNVPYYFSGWWDWMSPWGTASSGWSWVHSRRSIRSRSHRINTRTVSTTGRHRRGRNHGQSWRVCRVCVCRKGQHLPQTGGSRSFKGLESLNSLNSLKTLNV